MAMAMMPMEVQVPEELGCKPAQATSLHTCPMYAQSSLFANLDEQGLPKPGPSYAQSSLFANLDEQGLPKFDLSYEQSSLFANLDEQGLPRMFLPPGLDGWMQSSLDSTPSTTLWAQEEDDTSPLHLVGSTLLAACHIDPPQLCAGAMEAEAAMVLAASSPFGCAAACAAAVDAVAAASPPESAVAAVADAAETPSSGDTTQLNSPDCVDDVETEAKAVLAPLIREIVKGDAEWLRTTPAKGDTRSTVRWWSRPGLPLLCPVSEFPICLLPYPPFKLRVDPERAHPHRLVDGKYLAMQVIVTGRFETCGRTLAESDISALDEYIHRCKLGPYRVSRFVHLTSTATRQELERFQEAARGELGKLRRIQANRLTQIKKDYQARCLDAPTPAGRRGAKDGKERGRLSATSTASTRASSGSLDKLGTD